MQLAYISGASYPANPVNASAFYGRAMRAPTWHQKVATGDGSSKNTDHWVGIFICYPYDMRLPWLVTALILAGLMLGLHLWALESYLYWYYRWFDIPMHALGGAALGALIIAFIGRRKPWLFLAGMLGVVVGWEVFEAYARISTGQPDYWYDTTYDMINGLIGGYVVFAVAHLFRK